MNLKIQFYFNSLFYRLNLVIKQKTMTKYYILIFLAISNLFFAQSTRKIIKDLDGDSKKDTIRIDSDKNVLICALSTQNYKRIISKEIKKLNFGNTLVSTKKGFEFWNDYNRSGFRCLFEYNPVDKKIQLIQIKRTDDLLTLNSVETAIWMSKINLLTNKYDGAFYSDVDNEKSKEILSIEEKMVLPITYLDTFSDDLLFEYEHKCLKMYKKFYI